MSRKKVLIPGYEPPELIHTECAHCRQDIEVKKADVDAIPEGIDVHVLCVECIPPYLAGSSRPVSADWIDRAMEDVRQVSESLPPDIRDAALRSGSSHTMGGNQ